jgi:hypothetical protein
MFLRLVAAYPILPRAIDLDRYAVFGFYRILFTAALRVCPVLANPRAFLQLES